MTIVEESRVVFSAYAGMSADELPEDDWSSLQVRLARWQNANFPRAMCTDMHLAMGVIEEYGEFIYAESLGRELDAIADMTIFAMQLCTNLRLDFGHLYTFAEWSKADLEDSVLGLAHPVLKNSQGIRGMDDEDAYRDCVGEVIMSLAYNLGVLANGLTSDAIGGYMALVSNVAENVMQRNPKELRRTI